MEEFEERGEKIGWLEAIERADAIVIHGDRINESLENDNINNEDGVEHDETL